MHMHICIIVLIMLPEDFDPRDILKLGKEIYTCTKKVYNYMLYAPRSLI